MKVRSTFARIGAVSIFSTAVICGIPAAYGQSAAGAAQANGTQNPAAAPAHPGGGPASSTNTSTNAQAANPPSQYQMQDQSAPAGDSLADAARKAKAQKTAKTAAPHVYTDDSVTHLSGHGVSVVGDSSASSGDEQEAYQANAGGQAQAGASGEQYWRGRARAIRDQMAQIDRQIDGIRAEIAKQGAVSVDPQSGLQAGVIYITDRNAQIKQLEERKDGLQKQMDALEDEGRKDGADSGWFR